MNSLSNITQLYNDACTDADLMPSVQLQRIFNGLTIAKADGSHHQCLTLDASQCLFTRSHFELFLDVLQKIVQQLVVSVGAGDFKGELPIHLHLSLRNTGLDNGTVLTLSNAVAHLDGLEHIIVADRLDISDNVNVSTVGGKRLKRLCKEYKQLKFLNLSGCSLNAALQRQIEESAAENLSAVDEPPTDNDDDGPAEDTAAAAVTLDVVAMVVPDHTRAESPDHHHRSSEAGSSTPTAVVEQKTPQTEPRTTQPVPLTPSPPRQHRGDTSSRPETGASRLRTDRLEQSENLSCATENDPEMALAHKADATSLSNSTGDAPDFTSYTMPPDLTVAQQVKLSYFNTCAGNRSGAAAVTASPGISVNDPRVSQVHRSQSVSHLFPLMSRLSAAANMHATLEADISLLRSIATFGNMKSHGSSSATPRLDSLLDRLRTR
jgi:hypothetical protein